MIEVFGLVLLVAGIVRMARTRGASPWVYGLLAAGGWIAVRLLLPRVPAVLGLRYGTDGDGADGLMLFAVMLTTAVLSWLWAGGVALYVRFGVGRNDESPSGSWSCPNCRSLNQGYALKCDSCGQPFAHERTV